MRPARNIWGERNRERQRQRVRERRGKEIEAGRERITLSYCFSLLYLTELNA